MYVYVYFYVCMHFMHMYIIYLDGNLSLQTWIEAGYRKREMIKRNFNVLRMEKRSATPRWFLLHKITREYDGRTRKSRS